MSMRWFLRSWLGCLALSVILLGGILLSGCQKNNSPDGDKPPAEAVAAAPAKKPERPRGVFKRPDTAIEGDAADNSSIKTTSLANSGDTSTEIAPPRSSDPVGEVLEAVQDSAKLGPLLVVWMVDRTSSAEPLTRDVMGKVRQFYDDLDKAEGPKAAELTKIRHALKTAVITFGETTAPVVEQTADALQVSKGLQGLKKDEGFVEKPFTALIESVEKYQSLRTAERRELMFVIVTDEAGDDSERLEELLALSRRNGARFYAIGYPATLGRKNSGAGTVEGPRPAKGAQAAVTVIQGPDARQPDLVDLAGLRDEPIDAGVGPFAWEYLCRTSGGFYSVVREGTGSGGRSSSSLGYGRWPSGAKRFDAKAMAEYLPAYTSRAQYDELLSKNAACRALVAAAALDRVEQLPSPDVYFSKRNEAQLTQALGRAQRVPARVEPEINKLYDLLRTGEGDREKLRALRDGKRWLVAYDLAYGRAMAAKARVDGYNGMLAVLKRGRNFTKPGSNTWVLQTDDKCPEAGSQIEKLISESKRYLQMVIDEHPGTPWAAMAKQELQSPMGWKWVEQ